MLSSSSPLHRPSDLTSLIEHAEMVDASAGVEAVDRIFDGHHHEYMAVAAGPRVVGLCSRTQVQGLLVSRFGPSRQRRALICQHLLPECLSIRSDQTLDDLLESALSREGDAFYQDVVVVDGDFKLVGLIPARRIIHAQSVLMKHQARALAAQRAELDGVARERSRTLEERRTLEGLSVAALVTLQPCETGVTLILGLPDTETAISTDVRRIKGLLVDLVINAVDSMESVQDRRLTICVETTAASAQRSVGDVGSGIDEDHLLRKLLTVRTSVEQTQATLGRTA